MADAGRPGLRVVLVLGTSAGGVGRHVAMLAEGLTAAGHQVVVAGPRATDEDFGFTRAGAGFAEVGISDRPRPARDWRAVARLRAAAKAADVVHAHGLRAGALCALALAGRRAGLAVTLHNALTTGGAIGRVHRILEVIVARRAGQVLVVSPDLGRRMTALGARAVAPAVVPAPPLAPARRSAAEVREELDAGRRPILLTIARLAQQKGLETLLDAAAGPYDADPLFVVAGEGPLRAALEAGIERRKLPVRLLGDRGDVADLLAAADALTVPSRWEGQPLNVQEALRAGRPIIATAVGGIPDLVGDAALLVPAENAAALRAAIGRLLGDPGERARLAEASALRGRGLPAEPEAVAAVLRTYTRLSRGAFAGSGRSGRRDGDQSD
jgi:glycosyltransferase involved in cell wall biosynthesis